MNAVSRISVVLVSVLAVALSASPAEASTPVSCATRVDAFLNASQSDAGWLTGIGTAVTARGWFGFSRFTMAQGYQVETKPLHTSAAATSSTFTLGYATASDAFTGELTEVLPGRGNGDEDRTAMWVGRGGNVWLRSITWNGGWVMLQGVVCYAGPGNQLVVTGHIDNPGFGSDFWSFVLVRNVLI